MFVVLQKSAKGQDLIDRICEQVDLIEKDYYGLIFIDQDNTRNWLAADKKISKQIKCTVNFLINCGCLLTRCFAVAFSETVGVQL